MFAATATLAGFGLAWRATRPGSRAQVPASDFWRLRFVTPDGRNLALESTRSKPLLLNFWASWCAPCVEELPLLSRFYNLNAANGWQVVGLAVDDFDPVRRFLALNPVSFPVVVTGMPGIELSRSLGNMVGSLPFTVVLDSAGQIAHRKMGKVTADELLAWSTTS